MSYETGTAVIRDGFIELCKLMKLENMVASGGEAKQMISEGMVLVNGEVEMRKRRKIIVGDVVECNSLRITTISPLE
jgi:ribosome-associated protein